MGRNGWASICARIVISAHVRPGSCADERRHVVGEVAVDGLNGEQEAEPDRANHRFDHDPRLDAIGQFGPGRWLGARSAPTARFGDP